MNLRNKKTGETGYYLHTHRDHNTGTLKVAVLKDGVPFSEFKPHEPIYDYDSLAELNSDWEDYEPAEPLIKDEKIRKAVRAWWNIQENPFKCASVLCKSYSANYGNKDRDGYYNYCIYGYVHSCNVNKVATEFEFRTKTYFEYNKCKDYTIDELCGDEEE